MQLFQSLHLSPTRMFGPSCPTLLLTDVSALVGLRCHRCFSLVSPHKGLTGFRGHDLPHSQQAPGIHLFNPRCVWLSPFCRLCGRARLTSTRAADPSSVEETPTCCHNFRSPTTDWPGLRAIHPTTTHVFGGPRDSLNIPFSTWCRKEARHLELIPC